MELHYQRQYTMFCEFILRISWQCIFQYNNPHTELNSSQNSCIVLWFLPLLVVNIISTDLSIIKYDFASNQCTVSEYMVQYKNGMVWCSLFSMQWTITRMVRDPILWPSNYDILLSIHSEF